MSVDEYARQELRRRRYRRKREERRLLAWRMVWADLGRVVRRDAERFVDGRALGESFDFYQEAARAAREATA